MTIDTDLIIDTYLIIDLIIDTDFIIDSGFIIDSTFGYEINSFFDEMKLTWIRSWFIITFMVLTHCAHLFIFK